MTNKNARTATEMKQIEIVQLNIFAELVVNVPHFIYGINSFRLFLQPIQIRYTFPGAEMDLLEFFMPIWL